ncbi:carbohydrate ABC transporter permease [Lachnoclostridium sp. Marseille-P6806]|uniref:carbohydrate ABC transporter permease n=1 Tax=Lachnoclostridium sp. Marseille-P6806 TaxID=2364793 RepID=UPI001F5FB9F8|nr:carbohydrate ABC transporter permease [Lachnoclostridium sp. Marseille-P6806]
MTNSMKKNRLLVSLLIHVFLLVFSIVMIVPFVWMVLTSFKSITEATSVNPFVIFPSEWRTASFSTVWKNMSFLRLYRNTLLLIFWRVVCACLTATFAGYAFARLRFRGKNLAFGVVLVQMMIPTQIFVIPQYLMISRLGANNTMFALVFPGLVTAFGTFLLRQAYMGLPGELEEAARLDGCNIPQTFIFVMAPLATMQGQYSTKYPELMAASLIACLPMVVLYLLFQRQFIEGIATSGGKL